MIAYSFAPQSLLAPCAMFGLGLNLVAGPKIHGADVTQRDAFATFLIILGSIICLIFGAHGQRNDAPGSSSLGANELIFYAASIGTLCSLLGALMARLNKMGGH